MGMFSGINDAKVFGSSDWIVPGHYITLLNKIKAFQNRQNHLCVAIEQTVLHDFGDGESNPSPNRVGQDVAQVLNLTKHEAAFGNLRAMIANLLDVPVDKVGEKEAEELCDPDKQPLAGRIVEVQARTIKKQNGEPFTKIEYKRIISDDDAARLLSEDAIRNYVSRLLPTTSDAEE